MTVSGEESCSIRGRRAQDDCVGRGVVYTTWETPI